MKNKSVIALIVMLIGTFLSGFYGPWWAPAVFIVLCTGMIGLNQSKGSMFGAISMGITFLGMAIWMSTKDQEHIIEKTGTLLGGLSPASMILVTTVIGLVTGLLSGWLGSALGGILKKENSPRTV